MRTLILIAYVVMAAWLLISAILRVVILLGNELPLDPLPFVSAGLAVVALLAIRPVLARSRDRSGGLEGSSSGGQPGS